MGQIAQGSEADVVVVCLIGERGRELGDFLRDHLSGEARARTVVVCATSDAPALLRMKCPYVATTIAEMFRDQGKRVLLLVDSVTRFARAAREVGLATGEAPVRRGYPPDFAERCFEQIKGFGEYGFPESHAQAFGWLGADPRRRPQQRIPHARQARAIRASTPRRWPDAAAGRHRLLWTARPHGAASCSRE